MLSAPRNNVRPFVHREVASPTEHPRCSMTRAGTVEHAPQGSVDAPPRPMVVGLDMTREGRRIAVDAAQIASSTGVPLHLVLSVHRPWSLVVAGHGEAWNIDGYSVAEQFLHNLILELPVTGVTRTITAGPIAEAVKREAARLDARMIVVRGRRPFRRARDHPFPHLGESAVAEVASGRPN